MPLEVMVLWSHLCDTAALPWVVEQPQVLPLLLLCSLRNATNCLVFDSAVFKNGL